MSARLRENAVVLLLSLVAVAAVAWVTLYGFAWNDYDNEVAPAYAALVGGHVGLFLRLAPAYGGSVILRAPFALLPGLWGGGPLAVYRAVSLPCLLAAVAFATWLVARLRARGADRMSRVAVLIVAVANPVLLPTLQVGHPEEVLGAVLCVAAVLFALADRPLWAAIFLGLAIANKEWAVLAVGPVLLALPRDRGRTLLVAAAVSVLILAPLELVGPSTFSIGARAVATQTGTIFQPWQLWWFFGSHGHLVHGAFGAVKPGYRTPPAWLGGSPHLLIVAIALPLTVVCLARMRARSDALLLLTLLLLLRCVLDPWDTAYYAVPFLFALLAWEVLTRDRLPLLALAASVVTWLVFEWLPGHASADGQSLVYLACALPTVAALALRLYAPAALGGVRRTTRVQALPRPT